jgi:outer membrane receptor protein involved in Fe transport
MCIRTAVRTALASVLAAAATQALAQEAPQPAAEVQEVTVTGSRIQQVSGMNTPTPVTAIGISDLKVMAPTTLVDALAQLPQFLNNDTPQSQSFGSSGSAGASFINLRGMGANRTLTLLDGRRVVPSTRTGSLDIALIPDSLVQRVDVVTGGASAAYGSDAVSGVVNFVLDTNFTGLKANLQGGVSELGDNENYEAELSWGRALGDRAHIIAAVDYFQSDGIVGYRDRDWFNSCALIAMPAGTPGPRQVHACNVHSTKFTYGGLITTGPLKGREFLPGGVVAPFQPGTIVGQDAQAGGSGVDPGGDLVWIQPDQKRGTAFAHLTYDFTDDVQAFGQVLYGYTDNKFQKDPTNQTTAWEATIYADNAYLPASLRAEMAANNIDSFGFGRLASNEDLGGGLVDNESKMFSATTGLKWKIGQWSYDTYYQYGENNAVLTYTNTSRIDRLYRATDAVLDANGNAICRSTLTFPDDGCVPVNLFGAGSPSAEAIQYINGDRSDQDQTIKQHFAELVVQGRPFSTWAGDVSVATGGAYRKEILDNVVHRYPSSLDGLSVPSAASQGYKGLPASYSGAANIFERTAGTPLQGSYNVWEVFGETIVPLAMDTSFAKRLDANAAVRYMNYSGSGGIFAWKGGLDWQVLDELRLRATRSRDVRAGTLSERFDYSGTGANIFDPFLAGRPRYATTAIRSGNENVDPEKADTLTFGFVYQPEWLEGFNLSVDYFDIKIADAISSLGAQNILDQCFDGATSVCSLITRNPTTGRVSQINNTFLNVAEARSNGVDMEASYRRPVEWFGGGESIAIRAFTTFTNELSTTNAGASKVDRVGQTGLAGGAPKWQASLAVNYARGPLSIVAQERFISHGVYDATYTAADIDDNSISSAAYTNLRLAYDINPGDTDMTIYANVTNLFDEDPPLVGSWSFIGSGATNESLFDVLGRRYTLGVRMSF